MSETQEHGTSLVAMAMSIGKPEIALELLLQATGGEITVEVEKLLAVSEVHIPAKVDSYQAIIERFTGFAKFHREKAEIQTKLARQMEAVVDRLKGNIRHAMTHLVTDELSGNDVKFRLMNSSPSVKIDDEAKIDPMYTTIEQKTVINKDRIKQDLSMGVPVPGCRLEQSTYVRAFPISIAKRKDA